MPGRQTQCALSSPGALFSWVRVLLDVKGLVLQAAERSGLA